jgi:phage-related protein
MNWQNILKEDGEMRSIAKDVLAFWRTTDWRTSMLDDIIDLPEKVNSHSVEKLQEIYEDGSWHLTSDKDRKEFKRLMNKLIELKGSEER